MLPWHTHGLMQAFGCLSDQAKARWIWWRLPQPTVHRQNFRAIIEDEPRGVEWHTEAETKKMLAMMSTVNAAKVQKAQQCGGRIFGTIYKRTRKNDAGEKAQCAEVRFDNVAGCLRTPTGGSSRQSILVIEGQKISSRLLSPREAARLMGLPDNYVLPQKYNEAYHLVGDGVAVPVVRFLAQNILELVLAAAEAIGLEAA
jgi:DNA (cytosine-5)-methyltransferase 1